MRYAAPTALALVFFLGAAAGCAKQPVPPVDVQGKVVNAAGKPFAEIVLTFHPQDDANRGELPSPLTDKAGGFRFRCLPGRYKVTAAVPPRHGHADPSGGAAVAPPGSKDVRGIPLQYRTPDGSPLLVEIPGGGKEDLLLTLK